MSEAEIEEYYLCEERFNSEVLNEKNPNDSLTSVAGNPYIRSLLTSRRLFFCSQKKF